MWLPYSHNSSTKTQQHRLQGQNTHLEGLVRFLVVSPDAAGTPKGSHAGTATAHEGDPNWGPPPLWELLAPTLTKPLLGPAATGVIQLHTCPADVVKWGT